MSVGNRLRESRKAQGLTQLDLQKISGVKQGTIGALERGFLKKSTFILQLADALAVDPQWLDTGEERQKEAAEITPLEREILKLLRVLDPEELRREVAYLQKQTQKEIKI